MYEWNCPDCFYRATTPEQKRKHIAETGHREYDDVSTARDESARLVADAQDAILAKRLDAHVGHRITVVVYPKGEGHTYVLYCFDCREPVMEVTVE